MPRSALMIAAWILAACAVLVTGVSPSFADDRSDCKSPGDASKRIAACSRAIKAGKLKGSELAAIFEARGRAYIADAKRDLAIADFNEGIRVGPSADLLANRGEIQLEDKAYDRAVADFDAAIRLEPKSKRLYFLRGKAYAAQLNFERAIPDFDEAIRIDGGLSSVGTNAAREKGVAQAALLFQQMSSTAPACMDVNADVQQRIEGCKRILAAGKIKLDVLLTALGERIDTDNENERLGDLISNITVLLGLNPDDLEMLLRRGLAYHSSNENDLALADFNQLGRKSPGNKSAAIGRGAALFGRGDFDAAIAELSEVLRKDREASAFGYRGRAYAKNGDYVRALSDFDEFLKLEPGDRDAERWREEARSELAAQRKQTSAATRPPAVAAIPKSESQQIAAIPPLPPAQKPAQLPDKFTGKRVALVIGNAAYKHVATLDNTINDARIMRDALTKLGFEVVYGENLDRRAMGRHIGEFGSIVREADAAIVYFAGHGSTFADIPYVVPIDSKYETLSDIPAELIQVESLVSELRRAKGVRLVILDACRDNEREIELKRQDAAVKGIAARGGAVSRGLAKLQNPDGLIVVYSTQHMTTAADGKPGGNSPFTGTLARHLVTPGVDIKDVLFRTASEVVKQSGGTQRPEIAISLFEPFVLAQ